MLTNAQPDADSQREAGQPTPTPPEADPGARSTGDPSRSGVGYMGPSGLRQDTDLGSAVWASLVLTELEYRSCGTPRAVAMLMAAKAKNVAMSLLEHAEERWGKRR